MFQKVIGIIGVIAVMGVIAMVAISPRAEGFFPDMFDSLRPRPAVESTSPQEADRVAVPVVDTLPAGAPTEPAGHAKPAADTLVAE